ncbi:MAG: DUF6514 family protein [Clostridiales bacterium]|nr:DUF6514 family protein [Clostridiales bacterium]
MKEIMAVEVENLTIRYFRTEGEACCDDGKNRIFGISAAKYIGDNEEERADAGYISENMAYVDELIAILGKNSVTPMVLGEILDELIA